MARRFAGVPKNPGETGGLRAIRRPRGACFGLHSPYLHPYLHPYHWPFGDPGLRVASGPLHRTRPSPPPRRDPCLRTGTDHRSIPRVNPPSPYAPPRFPVVAGVAEYLVYRYRTATTKGLQRELVTNVLPGSNMTTVLWNAGIGRYRVEARDQRRQVRKVYVFEVHADGRIIRARPLKRPPKVPPPQYVA